MTILYRLSTSFVVVKTVLENICRSCSNFVVVKTGLSNFYRPSTGFGEVQQASFDYRIACWRSVEVWQPHLNVLVACSGLCDTFYFNYHKACWMHVEDCHSRFDCHTACWRVVGFWQDSFDCCKQCRWRCCKPRQFWLPQIWLKLYVEWGSTYTTDTSMFMMMSTHIEVWR